MLVGTVVEGEGCFNGDYGLLLTVFFGRDGHVRTLTATRGAAHTLSDQLSKKLYKSGGRGRNPRCLKDEFFQRRKEECKKSKLV
jgi:hypothetical protein